MEDFRRGFPILQDSFEASDNRFLLRARPLQPSLFPERNLFEELEPASAEKGKKFVTLDIQDGGGNLVISLNFSGNFRKFLQMRLFIAFSEEPVRCSRAMLWFLRENAVLW